MRQARRQARVEKEIPLPVLQEAIEEEDLMDELDAEHASAKSTVALFREMEPDDDECDYDTRMTVLGERIDHHFRDLQD